ncbi:hypothetical protein K443DRAFT_418654 [Laccaria amethystina LaAM-08-1]|uniref:Uncharacterized protein n=1 Tax=Laccaria amethystina LaAM-08-1 TaxID=1095629 RepID=A0A0C9WIG8_9AGAR|nr:hypothetical protein K443DRAFT_418654 [Laccaria amethystina LaAM-08-1]
MTRVALEAGTQGILGGVQGTWTDLTRNVNKMASNLTDQVRSISEVAKAVALNGKIVQILGGGGSRIVLDGKCYCLRWRLYASTCLFRPQRFHHHQCPPQTIDPFAQKRRSSGLANRDKPQEFGCLGEEDVDGGDHSSCEDHKDDDAWGGSDLNMNGGGR